MTWNEISRIVKILSYFSFYKSDLQAEGFNYTIKGEIHFILSVCNSNRPTLRRNGQGNVITNHVFFFL